MATKSKAPKRDRKAPPAGNESSSDSLVARHRKALPALLEAARSAADRLQREKVLQPGTIVLHSGSGAGGFVLTCGAGGTEFQPLEPGAETASARLEVICDPQRLTSIIQGRKDARMQFFAGGIRVRGDMAYLSEIGLKLGFLDRPLI